MMGRLWWHILQLGLLGFVSTALVAAEERAVEVTEATAVTTAADMPSILQGVAAEVYALMDSDQYAELYRRFAGAQFQQKVTAEAWQLDAGRARIGLGTPVGRTLQEIRHEKTIYGEPVVEIYSLLFAATYSEADVYDRLIMQQENGEWKVIGIWSLQRD